MVTEKKLTNRPRSNISTIMTRSGPVKRIRREKTRLDYEPFLI